MSRETLSLTTDLHRYLLDFPPREPDVLRRLPEETARHPQAESGDRTGRVMPESWSRPR
jgi:hypothetical protein